MLVLQDQLERDLLELYDTAARGDWLVSDNYRTARTRLMTVDNPIRVALGDDSFQQYLDASGQNTTVIVDSLFSGSAGSVAGLLAGDVIHSYAGTRIFSAAGLQLATTQGQRDNPADIVVIRNDQTVTLSIARGPIGVRVTAGDGSNAATL
jgi:S1-C subfamily serine protease